MTLEPTHPETALDLYLDDRANEVSQATIYSHRSRLGHFLRWCEAEEIDNLNDLTGRLLHQYRIWRRNEGDLEPVTEKTQMDTLRVFVRWLESIDGVQQDLHVKVRSPSLGQGENVRTVQLAADEATALLAYLEKYEYGTLPHVAMTLLWRTSVRVGGLHALDLDDYRADDQYLEVRHRPEEDTPIKNKLDGERLIALSEPTCELLDDWISDRRPDVSDEYGREPLLTTEQGRAAVGTIRTYAYRWTRPCEYGEDCPHDREIETCEATESGFESQCPSSVSPHPIRRGSLTHYLNEDVPYRLLSDRANVSPEVLEKHYDARTKEEKMEQRRRFLEELDDE